MNIIKTHHHRHNKQNIEQEAKISVFLSQTIRTRHTERPQYGNHSPEIFCTPQNGSQTTVLEPHKKA